MIGKVAFSFFAVLLMAWLSMDIATAQLERRLALVIGNGAYGVAPLVNPANDAEDMAAALRKYGFVVTLKQNISQREMEDSIRQFGKLLQKGGVGLFFFAGHGVQIDGCNYLIPTDAAIHQESDVKYEAVDAGRVLDAMEGAGNELNIVILDACRDNPYASSFRSMTRGLARMDAPKGTLIAYSTSPGKVALDGNHRNSPYTRALLKYMDTRDLTLEQVFKNVRKDIDADTRGKQIPWESTSLTGTFFFEMQRGIQVKKKEASKGRIEAEGPRLVVAREERTGTLPSEYPKYFSLLARDEVSEATRYFTGALKERPNDEDARAGAAIGMALLGAEEDARYQLKRLKETRIMKTNTRMAIGFLEGLHGMYVDGFCELKRALGDGGDKALIQLCMAAVAERSGDYPRAEKAMVDYRTLVPTYERGAFYKQIADRLEVLNKLVGTYLMTHEGQQDVYAFGITFSRSAGSLTGTLIQQEGSTYYNLQKLTFDAGKLTFRVREEMRQYWAVNEYEAEPKGAFQRIPVKVTQLEGNCGQNGFTSQTYMVRESGGPGQSRSLQLYPTGKPLAHGAGCFIATAAYGSPSEGHVMILREFRDRILLPSRAGRIVTDLYYQYSPDLARVIEKRAWARTVVRLALAPVVILAGACLGRPSDFVALALLVLAVAVCFRLRPKPIPSRRSLAREGPCENS